MIKHNQDGAANPLLLPLIIAVVLLVGSLSFGAWAFTSRADYKDNSDQKVAAAVVVAKAEEGVKKDKQYAEASKLPLKTFNGPEEYGSIALQYPKTWSGYVTTGQGSQSPLDGYFHPDIVPNVGDQNSAYALRVQIVDQSYSEVLSSYDSQEGLSSTPYALPKVPKVVGVKLDGQLEEGKKGSMVILPVRDKTLQIFTQSDSFQADFNNLILANLSFSP